jgi:hypothetical protein
MLQSTRLVFPKTVKVMTRKGKIEKVSEATGDKFEMGKDEN